MTPSGTSPSGKTPGQAPALKPEMLATLHAGLRLMALRALGDPDGAEEVAQETLARALGALHDGQAGDIRNLGGFVHGIARHVIGDMLRRRGRMAGPDILSNTPDPASLDDPLSRAVSEDEHARVRAALRRLSRADQEILRLSFYEGLTPAEVASQLSEPALRVRKRKSRALERLREAFRSEAGGHGPTPRATDSRHSSGEIRDVPGEGS